VRLATRVHIFSLDTNDNRRQWTNILPSEPMITGSGDMKFKTPVPAEFSHPHSPKHPRILQKYFEINRLEQWLANFFSWRCICTSRSTIKVFITLRRHSK
jgi:hypothetical protein